MVSIFNNLEKNIILNESIRENGGGTLSNEKYIDGKSKEFYSKFVGKIDDLGNIEYNLKSNENRIIRVPASYARKSLKLVNYALESKGVPEFKARVEKSDVVGNMYIPEEISNIIGRGRKIGSLKSRKTVDKIYFTSCLHQCYNELPLSTGEKRYTLIRQTEFFKDILNTL